MPESPAITEPVEPTPAPGRPKWFRPLLVGIAMLAALAVYLHGVFMASETANLDSAKGNQSAYLQYAFKLKDSHWQFKTERNRMPALPMLLSVFVDKDWDWDTEFFPFAKTLCIVLSVLCLGAVAGGCAPVLGWRSGLLLTLLLAFTLYIFRAAYVQAEVLYYTSSGLAFIGALVLLRRPGWGLALALGVLFGLTHLVKASILPAVVLTVVILAGRLLASIWSSRKAGGAISPELVPLALSIVLVPAAYLATIAPYLIHSKALYGHAFYNVNSTFYIWQNNFQESKAFSSKYNDRRAYPAAPPEEIPSAGRYFTTTPPAKIRERLATGLSDQVENLRESHGAPKYLIGLAMLGALLSWPMRGQWRAALGKHVWELLYAGGYLLGFGLLITFYAAIANGPRFTFTLYLPVLFLLFYWVTKLPEWRPAWFGKLRFPEWFGLRALGVALMLIALFRDVRVNLHDVLPTDFTGT